MKIKLYEAKWLHAIEGDLAHRFRTALDEENLEDAVSTSIELLNNCNKFFDPEGQDYALEELQDLIEDFESVEMEYTALDNLLDDLYDFCDEYNIWIPLIDEEEQEDEIQPEVEPEAQPEPEAQQPEQQADLELDAE